MEINLENLEHHRLRFSAAEFAPNTLCSYAEGWRYFTTWCEAVKLDPLPCSGETLALYATSLIVSGRTVTTARNRVSAVSQKHKQLGYPTPVDGSVARLLCGARRMLQQRPRIKAALTVDQLRSILSTMDGSSDYWTRNRAILTLGFACGMRRSEICGLDLDDVAFTSEGVRVTIRRSKTDQAGKGRNIGVHSAKSTPICAVVALQAWLAVRGGLPGPLFLRTQNGYATAGRLCGESVNSVVKTCVERIGLDRAAYGAHTLRASFITAAVIAGASVLAIMQRTGHTSVESLNDYVRAVSAFDVNPLANVL